MTKKSALNPKIPKTRSDTAKEDITKQACRKVDSAHGPSLLIQIKLLIHRDRDDDMLVWPVDNGTEETSRLDEKRLATHAPGPSRRIYSLRRRVYGPVI